MSRARLVRVVSTQRGFFTAKFAVRLNDNVCSELEASKGGCLTADDHVSERAVAGTNEVVGA